MAKKQSPANLIIPLLLIAGIGLFIYTGGFGFNLLATPDCTFPDGGGSCEYTLTLPQGSSASIYALDLEFGSVAASQYTAQTELTPIIKDQNTEERSRYDEEDTYEMYLYKLPASYENVQDVRIEATMDIYASCDREGESGQAGIGIVGASNEYPSNNIGRCTASSTRYCPATDLYYDYRDTRGDDKHRFINTVPVAYQEILRCKNRDPLHRTQGTVVGEWKNVPDINASQTAFVVYGIEREEDSAVVRIDNPKVTVSYKPRMYPSGFSYAIKDVRLETYNGIQTEPRRTLDFAESVNRACGRDRNKDACTVSVVFESATAGTLFVSEERTLRLADPNVGLEPEEPFVPPAEDPRAGGDTDEPTDEAPPGPGVGAWFANIWNNIASFFRGVFTI